jgi:hypothetical protein
VVQVDPIKPTLKAPGIKLFKLKYDKPLPNFAFKFNLRRYAMGVTPLATAATAGNAMVRRCRLTLSNPS